MQYLRTQIFRDPLENCLLKRIESRRPCLLEHRLCAKLNLPLDWVGSCTQAMKPANSAVFFSSPLERFHGVALFASEYKHRCREILEL